jgi:UDPglucose 6-dehydrogenase
MKKIKINKISKRHYRGSVYNMELISDSDKDDLFWIEQNTGIVTHNCFPKDINALIATFYKENVEPILIKASWELNKKIKERGQK